MGFKNTDSSVKHVKFITPHKPRRGTSAFGEDWIVIRMGISVLVTGAGVFW